MVLQRRRSLPQLNDVMNFGEKKSLYPLKFLTKSPKNAVQTVIDVDDPKDSWTKIPRKMETNREKGKATIFSLAQKEVPSFGSLIIRLL